MTTFQGPDGKEIVFVEWHKSGKQWFPHSIITTRSTYDVDFSEYDGSTYYHCSGGGCSDEITVCPFADTSKVQGRIFSLVDVVDKDGNKLTAKGLRALGYHRVKELTEDPFENAIEGQVAQCDICGMVPEDSHCRHINDAYDGNGFSLGAGAPDIDLQDTKRSMFRLFRWMSTDALKMLAEIVSDPAYSGLFHTDSILGGSCRFQFTSKRRHVWLYLEPVASDGDYDERYAPATSWLYSLDDKTRMQNCLTAGWIWEYLSTRDHLKFINVELEEMPKAFVEAELGSRPDQWEIAIEHSSLGEYRDAVEFKADPRSFDEIQFYVKGKEFVRFTILDACNVQGNKIEVQLGVCLRRKGENLGVSSNSIVTSMSRYKVRKKKAKCV